MPMPPPSTFTTARLLLRPPQLTDAQPIFDTYAQDPLVTRYLSWLPHQRIEETLAFMEHCIRSWQDGASFPWVILRRDDGTLIGMIDAFPKDFRVMLGYVLARPYWGQGYTSEAVRAVVDWFIAQPEIYRVWAICDTENIGSARVLEKSGMQREGILRNYVLHNITLEPRDVFCYARVK